VEDADGPRMSVEKLSEVGLAEPPVDAVARLDADDLRYVRRATQPRREVGLAETSLADQTVHAVLQTRLRTRDDLRRHEQKARPPEWRWSGQRTSRRGQNVLH